MLPIEIHNMQIHQLKRKWRKKVNQFVDFNIQNHQWNIYINIII
jgi:hypothetical protein